MNPIRDTSLGTILNPWSQVSYIVFFAIAYWISVRLGLLLVAHPEGIATIWPASGLGLGILLLSPKHKWWKLLAVIFATNAAGNWSGGNSITVSLGFALANTVEPLLCAWVLIYLCKSKILFNRTVEIFALFDTKSLKANIRIRKVFEILKNIKNSKLVAA